MLIWLVFSNIVHPWYLPVILRTDVQHDVMEHRGHVKKKKKKKLLKQILRGYYIYAACLLMEYSDTLGTIKINELKKSESK